MRLLTIVAVASSLAAEKPPLPPETLELAGLARSAPPEIAAAALLRLVESSRVPDREQQFEFIEEAFALAAQARSPYPLSAGRRAEPDTRAGYQLAASGLALDRLSLQTRAVQLLLSADPPRALELFRRIPRPSPPPAACGQVLFPLPGGYYLTMLGVLEKSYSAGQRKAGDDLRDRLSWAAALQSPTEFGFALQVFALSSQEEDHRSMGMIALIGRLRQMQTDWPTFTATAAQTIRDAGVLADRYAQSGGERAVVWDALRAYLLRHLAGPRCAGNEAEAGSILRQFNAKAAQNGVASIEADEVRASREIDEDSPPALYYATDETQAIARALRELRFDPQGRVWNEEVRRGVQWRRRFDETLTKVRDWTLRSDEDELDWFHQKALTMRSLYEMAPPGEERGLVLQELLSFLNGASAARTAPAEWMWHVASIHQAAMIGVASEGERALAAMKSAGGTLALFAVFQELGMPLASLDSSAGRL